jgi:hypothetical protein
MALLAGLPGCEDINPGLVVGVRPDPTGTYDAARLFGEDLPAIFPDGDEIWVYQSAGLDILSDGTYDLEVDASLTLPDTVYVGLLLGSGTWDRSPLSNSVLTIDVPVVDFVADGDTILTGRFELQTALAIELEGLVSLGGAPDDVWVKN